MSSNSSQEKTNRWQKTDVIYGIVIGYLYIRIPEVEATLLRAAGIVAPVIIVLEHPLAIVAYTLAIWFYLRHRNK